MKIDYIPPRRGTYRIEVAYWHHKTLFEDVGTEASDWRFTPTVLDWFKTHDPKAKWGHFDCGDFGDGDPIATINFTSLDTAERFAADFAKASS